MYFFEAETTCVAEHNMGQVASSGVNNLSFFDVDEYSSIAEESAFKERNDERSYVSTASLGVAFEKRKGLLATAPNIEESKHRNYDEEAVGQDSLAAENAEKQSLEKPNSIRVPQSNEERKFDPKKTYMAFIIGDGDNLAFMKGGRQRWFEDRLRECNYSKY